MIKVTGVKRTIDKLMSEVAKKKAESVETAKDKMVVALREATPVDTGFARDSWIATNEGVINTAPYIAELNEGTSQQAPAFFIERTVLSQPNIVPNGSIVRYD